MNRLSILQTIAATIGILPTDKAHPLQKEFFESVYKGRPRINSDRPKPKRSDITYLQSRHKVLPKSLTKLKHSRHLQNRINRYSKSKRTKEQQQIHDERIIYITARRFSLSPGQQFPLEAIIIMADKGVIQAMKQYNKLAEAAEQWNISVRQAYNHFVLGKELPAFNSHIKKP